MRETTVPPQVAHTVDAVASAVVVGAVMQWVPPIAAILSVIWFLYQIYDLRDRRRARKLNQKRRSSDAV